MGGLLSLDLSDRLWSYFDFEEACVLKLKLKNQDIQQILSNRKYTHKCSVGDFSYRSINWDYWFTPHKETSEKERLLEALCDFFLYQHVTEPTRPRGMDQQSLIDLMLTNKEEQVSNLDYLPPRQMRPYHTFIYIWFLLSNWDAILKDTILRNPTLMGWKNLLKNPTAL